MAKYFGSVVIHSAIECYVEADTKEEAETKMLAFAEENDSLADVYEIETSSISVWDDKTSGDIECSDMYNVNAFDSDED